MTQPAKAQEPSMEEILASIRRIIADDEAKPPAAEKPAAAAAPAKPEKPVAAPPPAKPAMKEAPPPPAPAPPPAAAKAPAPPPKPAPAPAPPPAPAAAASNSQDDIDALLNGLDEVTTPEEIRPPLPDADVFELTDEMAVEVPAPEPPQPVFRKVDPQDDVEFAESAAARHRQPAFEPPALESSSPSHPILSRSTVSAVEIGVQLPGQYRAQQQRTDAGRPGQGNAAPDAEILARRQFAGAGGTHRQGGNRAGFPRTVTGP